MVEFSLGKKSYSVTRPKLRKWLVVEKIRAKILESAEKKDKGFVEYLLSYLSALLSIPEDAMRDVPWYEVIQGYQLSTKECSPKLDLSIIASGRKDINKPDKLPEPWEYDERLWYSWCSLLSKAFGWSIEYNAELDVDDAIALIQEIELDEQFKKEWEWSLTEFAYKTEPGTKKARLQPLPRPDWMKNISHTVADKIINKPAIQVPMRPSFIPAGVVISNEETKVSPAKPTGDSHNIRPIG